MRYHSVMRHYDHIDLRVSDLALAGPFYEALLPQLGFTRKARIEQWVQYEVAGEDGSTEFFGVTESPGHRPNENRIAFHVDSRGEVDRLTALLTEIGALTIEGPLYEEPDSYYAVFFEDPCGNRLEICHRTKN